MTERAATGLGDLRLAPPTLDDRVELHELYADPRVWQHYPTMRHVNSAKTDSMLAGWLNAWDSDGLGQWIVRDDGGRFLGHGGCSVRGGVFWNLGYRFSPAAQGRGYATRVSQHAVATATRLRPDLPVVAYLLEHNLASKRVAEKIGMTLQHSAIDAGNPDPTAIRLVYADRTLTAEQLAATLH